MASWKQYFEHGSAHADFCEANYAVSSFISEWWNTASSVLMALVGVIGFMLCVRHQLERRFKVSQHTHAQASNHPCKED